MRYVHLINNKFVVSTGIAVALVCLGLAANAAYHAHAADPFSPTVPKLFGHLQQNDASLPATIADLSGGTVSASQYQGHLAMVETCIETPACPEATTYQGLGAANVALTAAVDDVLLEQYGTTHGITVSEDEITSALQTEAKMMQQGLAHGGAGAQVVQIDLKNTGLQSPEQIVTSPTWRKDYHHSLLRSKTIATFVTSKLPEAQRGGPESVLARADFLSQLQKDSSVSTHIGAHILDPHVLTHVQEPVTSTPGPRGLASMSPIPRQ